MIPQKLLRLSFALALAATVAPKAAAQTGVFTYQGVLKDNGAPANGLYDFQFTLYNAVTAVAGPLPDLSVGVTNGLFTAQLDFGAGVFDGTPRWLEIAVRTNGAAAFITLAGRQPITSTPYAIQSLTASSVASSNINGSLALSQLPSALVTNGSSFIGAFSGNGSGLTNLSALALPTNVVYLNTPQTFSGPKIFTQPTIFTNVVGIETYNPDSPLTVQGIGVNGEWMTLKSTNGSTRWHMNNTFGGWNFVQTGVADYRLFLSTNGNVGLGISDPQAKLHVDGNILLNINGATNFAASGQENLRIVRGTIFDNGSTWNIFAGAGFTVAHPSAGSYTITFNRPFADLPSVTATGFSSIARADTVGSITTSQVKVSLINGVGSPVNDSFSFIAVGPASDPAK
jgi:hypothetical protein